MWPRAYPETTANLYFKRPQARALTPNDRELAADFAGAGRVQICLEHDVRYWAGRIILQGWAMGFDGTSPRALRIHINQTDLGAAQIGLIREDVLTVFPERGNRSAGFNATGEFSLAQASDTVKITLEYEHANGDRDSFTIDYLLQTGAAIFNPNCLEPAARA